MQLSKTVVKTVQKTSKQKLSNISVMMATLPLVTLLLVIARVKDVCGSETFKSLRDLDMVCPGIMDGACDYWAGTGVPKNDKWKSIKNPLSFNQFRAVKSHFGIGKHWDVPEHQVDEMMFDNALFFVQEAKVPPDQYLVLLQTSRPIFGSPEFEWFLMTDITNDEYPRFRKLREPISERELVSLYESLKSRKYIDEQIAKGRNYDLSRHQREKQRLQELVETLQVSNQRRQLESDGFSSQWASSQRANEKLERKHSEEIQKDKKDLEYYHDQLALVDKKVIEQRREIQKLRDALESAQSTIESNDEWHESEMQELQTTIESRFLSDRARDHDRHQSQVDELKNEFEQMIREQKDGDTKWGICSCIVGGVMLIVGSTIIVLKWRAKKEIEEKMDGVLIAQRKRIMKDHEPMPKMPSHAARLGVHEHPAVRDVFGIKEPYDVTAGEGFHVARITGTGGTSTTTQGAREFTGKTEVKEGETD